jgi:hypothetical protein
MLFSFFFWLEPVAFASALSSQAPQREGSAFSFAGAPPSCPERVKGRF